ncbi:glycerophosphodiester phosphodiesterase [Microlunatus speluncae]|uniref:glycerophosphodiester phosphodiesterase n=1 Tax=Microlunatus speluncae TaxID=2594267 RepID=UPI00137562E0|nr:glycerophosphodiester phosphodiesterase family protein [Microlunatus speluncae]
MNAPRPQTHHIFAHRGFSGHQPEMTIAAFRAAIDWAAETGLRLGLECDVQFSADDQLICLHDSRIDRTSTTTGVAFDFTVAELKAIDFGSRQTPNPTDEQRTLITLAELLIMVRDARQRDVDVTLAIETKHPNPRGLDTEDRVAAMLAEHGWDRAGSPVRIISFSMEALIKAGQLLPELERTYLQQFDFGEYETGKLPDGIEAFGPDIAMLKADPDFVARARDNGHEVHPWTLNEPADIDFALSLGVQGLTTDYPDRVWGHVNAPSRA